MKKAAFFFFAVLSARLCPAAASVRYDLSFPNAAHHEAEVRATFSGITANRLEVVMSRSSPGRYALHEFAKNVSNFRASDAAGHPLKVDHPDTNLWSVQATGDTVVCLYTLFGDHADGTYAAIDQTHAHLNLPAVLAWARGWEHASATLNFQAPEGSGWRAATQLVAHADGTFSAPNLEWMMDSPVELSASPMREWTSHNAKFRLALHHGGSQAEADAFEQKCHAIVAEEEAVFGSFPQFDGGSYTFLVDYLPFVKNDGMEHRDSTVITFTGAGSGFSNNALGAVSHEFFHAWNVKRIRPRSLEPFDFERADMSRELWFAEGFTNYYGYLVLRRANLISLDEFLMSMGGAVNAVLNKPGHLILPAAGMSAQAPFVDAATSIDPTDVVNNYISYYTYGQALAFGIDLAIRAHYPGKSLDDWMRVMWREHPDISQPYSMADLERTLGESTGDPAFARQIFQRNIEGLEPLDYASLVSSAGLTLVLQNPGKAWLGVSQLTVSSTGLALSEPTLRGSPLYIANIDRGDELQSCDGRALKDMNSLDQCLAAHKPGDVLKFGVQGRTGTREAAVTASQDPTLSLGPSEAQGKRLNQPARQFREQWLSSQTGKLVALTLQGEH